MKIEHIAHKESGALLPAVHAFTSNGILSYYGFWTGLAHRYIEMRSERKDGGVLYTRKFLNGCKVTKKKPFTSERRVKKSKNEFPVVRNGGIDALVGHNAPVSRVVDAVPNEVHMMNVDVAEDEDVVFVDSRVLNFEHPRGMGGVKMALTSLGYIDGRLLSC